MKETFTLQQKTKVLHKLFRVNCKTEKELQALDMENILKKLILTKYMKMENCIYVSAHMFHLSE